MEIKNLSNLVVVTQNHRPLACLPFESIFKSNPEILSAPGAVEKFRLWRMGIADIGMVRAIYAGRGNYPLTIPHPAEPLMSHLPHGSGKQGSSIVLTTGTWDPHDPHKVARSSIWSKVCSVLSLTPNFISEVQNRASEWPNQDLLGVHFRNSDNKSNLEEQLLRVETYLNQEGTNSKIRGILWCTDDQASIDVVRRNFRNLEVFAYQPFDVAGHRNLHRSLPAEKSLAHLSSTFQDLYSLASARHFLPTTGPSEWTPFVKWLRANPLGAHGFFGASLDTPV